MLPWLQDVLMPCFNCSGYYGINAGAFYKILSLLKYIYKYIINKKYIFFNLKKNSMCLNALYLSNICFCQKQALNFSV